MTGRTSRRDTPPTVRVTHEESRAGAPGGSELAGAVAALAVLLSMVSLSISRLSGETYPVGAYLTLTPPCLMSLTSSVIPMAKASSLSSMPTVLARPGTATGTRPPAAARARST